MREKLSKQELEAECKFSLFQNLLKLYRYASVKGLPKWNSDEPGLNLDFVMACKADWNHYKCNGNKQRVIDTVSAGWEAFFRFKLFRLAQRPFVYKDKKPDFKFVGDTCNTFYSVVFTDNFFFLHHSWLHTRTIKSRNCSLWRWPVVVRTRFDIQNV